MRSQSCSKAFTIIELLVVVSIIALLIGVLLPAIGKARDSAKLTQSQSNIKQMGTAVVTYAAEWGDRQVTWVEDYLSRYGTSAGAAFAGYAATNANGHPVMDLGTDHAGVTWYLTDPTAGSYQFFVPIDFTAKFGTFRLLGARSFHDYVNGRWYDPVYFAPKDDIVLNSTEKWFDHPGEYTGQNLVGSRKLTSYCYSPAAMWNPMVLSKAGSGNTYYTNPFTLEAGHKSPSLSQAAYTSQKTQLMEHHWLQNRKVACNPLMNGSIYDCEPYYFNAAGSSSPVAVFFDGHTGPAGCYDAEQADARVKAQSNHGLWSRDTPMGGDSIGYWEDVNYEPWVNTSFHILTIDGIKGRDFIK